MATGLHFVMALAAAAATSLVAATWQGIVLAMCVALVIRMLPGISAAARSTVWLAALMLIVLLHFAPFAAYHAAAPSLRADVRWSLVICCAWGPLSMFRAIQLARSAIHLRKLARTAIPVTPASECLDLLQAHFRLGQRRVELCTSTDVDRPCVVGFFSPRILVPPALLATLSTAELEQIVLHEVEHLRRRDDWLNLLQKVVLVVFPLNPALFWIERRLCAERERACDDGVLRSRGAHKAYAVCLTKLAEHSLARRCASLALGAWEKQSELARRIHRILRQPESSANPTRTRFATSAVLLGVIAAAAALAASPQLVSFMPANGLATLQAQIPAQRFAAPVAAMPVVYRQDDMQATPLKAVLSQRRSLRESPARKHLRRRPDDTVAVQPRLRVKFVVLTGWREPAIPNRLTLIHFEYPNFSYTAIPTGDGWLIIQQL